MDAGDATGGSAKQQVLLNDRGDSDCLTEPDSNSNQFVHFHIICLTLVFMRALFTSGVI